MSPRPSTQFAVPDASSLLEIVDSFPPMTAVGIEPAGGGLNLHVKDLPYDERSVAGGLFGFFAPKSWHAIAITVDGTAVPLRATKGRPQRYLRLAAGDELDRRPGADSEEDLTEPDRAEDDGDRVDDPLASYSILVTRSGEFASKLVFDGDELRGSWPHADLASEAPQGVAVDALHRVMRLPSPGEEPPVALLTLGLWLDSIISEIAAANPINWDRAVALHLGYPGPTRLSPSVENVAEATIDCSARTNWERLKKRASRRPHSLRTLQPYELCWMDTTMYGRWIMSGLLDFDLVLAALEATGHEALSEKVAGVINEVSNRIENGAAPLYQTRIA